MRSLLFCAILRYSKGFNLLYEPRQPTKKQFTLDARYLHKLYTPGAKKMKLELNIDCLPNQINFNPLEIIKTGFVFNTGYKDIFLSPQDIIWKMGTHEIYSMNFYNPITYIGFIYIEIERGKKQILLLFQDTHDRHQSKESDLKRYKCFLYNSRKSLLSFTKDKDRFINIYMNHIDFIKPEEQERKTFDTNARAIQLSLF